MTTLNINGRRVTVDDSFLSLSPEQQAATVNEIAGHLGTAQPASPMQQQSAPWYAQAAQAADDMVRLAANGITFGYADKLAGALGGAGTEAERARSDAARDRAGLAGSVAELGGSLVVPMGAAGTGASLAGRFGTGAMQGLGGLAARSGLMAAEGAGYGALTASGYDQDIGTGAALGAAGGAAGNVVAEALAKSIGAAAGAFNRKPAIPSKDEVQAAARAAYDAAEGAGVVYTPSAIGKLRSEVIKSLTDMGYDPALQPGAAAVVRRLDGLVDQNVSLTGLDTLRKVASNGFVPGNKSNNKAIGEIVSKIDDLVTNPGSGDVLVGDAEAAGSAIKQARSLWSRLSKADKVEDALARADWRAASTGSGGNVDNATRQNLRRLLEKPRGFTPDELSAIETTVRGTPTQDALRLAGKLSPSGNGLMAALGVGGTMVNPAIGALSLGGMGAKAMADRMTQKNADDLLALILAGGSRSAVEAPKNAIQRFAESKTDALSRILMALGSHEAGSPGILRLTVGPN